MTDLPPLVSMEQERDAYRRALEAIRDFEVEAPIDEWTMADAAEAMQKLAADALEADDDRS